MNISESKERYFERKISSSWFSGVCAGIASYFRVNVYIVRTMFVAASFLSGLGLMAYLILLIAMPAQNFSELSPDEQEKMIDNNFKSIIGTLLVITGIFFIISTSTLISLPIVSDLLMTSSPLIIIVLGVILIKNYIPSEVKSYQQKKLQRSIVEKRISGVCGGFAAYLDFDVTIIRMIWIYTIFASLGISLLVYIFLAIYLPKHYGVDTLDK